jgi:predicted dehydrogenase
MRALADSGQCSIAALADNDATALDEARAAAPDAPGADSLDALFEQNLDGLVIATPSGQHAEQAIAALERGIPVFCQKPLARDAAETRRVIHAAEVDDRLLGVDLSYRWLRGVERIRERLAAGELGDVYAASLVFHNAYGPDKPWFYERASAGGGCVTDLGIHLIDLALWLLDFPAIHAVSGRCFANGRLLEPDADTVEDYASARLDLDSGASVDIACSWNLPAGRDADIRLALYGTRAGAAITNVNGSFYDFRSEMYHGTATEVLCEPEAEGNWGGRAAVDWAQRLAADPGFDPSIHHAAEVAEAIDAIYGRD